jgi:hypothetical protein
MGGSEGEHSSELIGVEETCALLEVTPDRIQVMVEDGLLTPVGGPGEPRFYRGEVVAARELGG